MSSFQSVSRRNPFVHKPMRHHSCVGSCWASNEASSPRPISSHLISLRRPEKTLSWILSDSKGLTQPWRPSPPGLGRISDPRKAVEDQTGSDSSSERLTRKSLVISKLSQLLAMLGATLRRLGTMPLYMPAIPSCLTMVRMASQIDLY